MTRRAVIDVGTNSVKILVADVENSTVIPVKEKSDQTRLGRGFYSERRLLPEAISETALAVARFARKAAELGAQSTRVIATSAARDAINQDELISAIREKSGLPVEVLTGEMEADLVFHGVLSSPRFAGRNVLILDVGGGSTEFILGEGNQQRFRQSFPLGTVRLMDSIPHSDPPSPVELAAYRSHVRRFIEESIKPVLLPHLQGLGDRPLLVGTGGTSTVMARIDRKLEDYDREIIESTRLTRTRVREFVEWLWRLPLREREKIPGLPARRADVMLAGVTIYEGILEQLGFDELAVTTRGLRFAAVLDPLPIKS